MSKTKIKTDEETTDEDEEDATGAKAPAKGKRDSVTVTWNGGERVYSRDLHGDDFEALAQALADQFSEATVA